MALRDEQADILGGPILQRPESGAFAAFSQYQFVFKLVTLSGLSLLVWIACARGLEHLKKHRELRYRKAMRRKHGIPDSDCRPFAVAYAAAKRGHLKREAQDPKKTTNYVSDHNSPAVDQRANAQNGTCLLRKRVPETTAQLRDYQLPGKLASVYDNKRPGVLSLDSADLCNSNPRRRVYTPEPLPVERLPVRRASRKDTVANLDDNEESRKRSFEDESDVEHDAVKKSRMDGDALKDGDEQADWYAQYGDTSSRRASKESLNRQPEDSCVHMNGQEGSKRVDDLCDEDHEFDEAMEGIDEDEVTELKAVARGKKRDRAEAGSTIGGDDEDDIRNARASHHRKRRTILHRVDIPTRGQKRDREIESPESEGEGVGSETSTARSHVQRSSKKKRGKRVSDEVGETSLEDPRVSKDPLCGGRRAGEGWEADGVQYKVGEKGERLRLTLLKKARNQYHMPQDSRHPDRSAALEIYVETWMTDEQYSRAEGRQELAWQEASREASGSKTPDILDSSTKSGKSLLWDSVKCSPSRRPCRQFISPAGSIRINPFEQWQPQPILGRRVASSSTVVPLLLPGVADSPTRPGFRGLSKWEKQDREAEAIARIRAKIEQQKKGPPQKPAEIPTSVTAPELSTKPLSVPTITLTPAPAIASEEKPDDRSSQSKPNSTISFATPSNGAESVKVTTTAAFTTATGFSLSSFPPASTSSTLLPNASTTPATNSSTGTAPFSFVKPQQPSSIRAAAPPSMMSSGFGKAATATSPPLSVSLPSTLGTTAQSQPPTTGSTSNPVPFSFTKSDVSSSILPPVVTKLQAPTSNVTSTSTGSPHPATFGSILSAKVETPAPPIPIPGTASESTKPTPLFSFSGITSSTSTIVPTSSTPSVPKFSFGQMSTSPFAPGSNLALGTASQPKPTSKFGQTPPVATEGTSAVPAADESKMSATPVSIFGTPAGLNEPVKASPFGTKSAFGSSTFGLPSASVTNLFGKPVTVDNSSSISTPPKPTLVPTNTESKMSATLAPASSKPPVFSFGGSNSGSKSAEGFKHAFGGAAGGSNSVPVLGGNYAEGKPTYTFGASVDGPKPTSMFGGNAESSKPTILGDTSKHVPVLDGAVEAKSTFTFGGAAETSGPAREGSNPFNTTDLSKPTTASGNATFNQLSSASPFTFGKKVDAPTSTSVSTNTFLGSMSTTQTQSAAPFNFAVSSGVNGSVLSQPLTSTRSGDSSHTVNGRPTNATPNVFEFAKTGNSNSSSTFTFSKPAAQNQKQEQ